MSGSLHPSSLAGPTLQLDMGAVGHHGAVQEAGDADCTQHPVSHGAGKILGTISGGIKGATWLCAFD